MFNGVIYDGGILRRGIGRGEGDRERIWRVESDVVRLRDNVLR